MPEYTLYSTEACHLCEIAEAMIDALREEAHFTYQKVDISDSDDLFERYGVRIPVLVNASGEELGWPFVEEQLRTFVGA